MASCTILVQSGLCKPPSLPPQRPTTTPVSVQYPHCRPLTARFVSLGIDTHQAQLLSDAIIKASHKLQNACNIHLRQSQQQLAQEGLLDQPTLLKLRTLSRALYVRLIEAWHSHVFAKLVPRLSRLRDVTAEESARNSSKLRRPFNQAAVPLLEQFFNRNAFPSRLDKLELAAQTQMDYRQIHVWFQNHRSRTRKEGKELRRPASSSPVIAALEESVLASVLPYNDEEYVPRAEPEVLSTDADYLGKTRSTRRSRKAVTVHNLLGPIMPDHWLRYLLPSGTPPVHGIPTKALAPTSHPMFVGIEQVMHAIDYTFFGLHNQSAPATRL
ncbi:hypothetical protein BD413DRAFT_675996 [Trametes elegans]|nr:hypothetical protein BD413DRAFT_675996 [Trametes elegans]